MPKKWHIGKLSNTSVNTFTGTLFCFFFYFRFYLLLNFIVNNCWEGLEKISFEICKPFWLQFFSKRFKVLVLSGVFANNLFNNKRRLKKKYSQIYFKPQDSCLELFLLEITKIKLLKLSSIEWLSWAIQIKCMLRTSPHVSFQPSFRIYSPGNSLPKRLTMTRASTSIFLFFLLVSLCFRLEKWGSWKLTNFRMKQSIK